MLNFDEVFSVSSLINAAFNFFLSMKSNKECKTDSILLMNL